MSETKKAETKNQHYVPQFYQRFFSADSNHKSIGAYVIKSRKYIPAAPIKNQSSGDYFYSDNQKIEEALGMMERLASEVFQQVLANPKNKLTNKDWYTAYAFTFMQIGRTLDRANLIQSTADSTAKLLLKKYVEAKRNTADAEEVELLTDEIIDSISVNLKKPAMFSLAQHASMVNTCKDLKLKVLINQTKVPFITSDNPACMYSMFMERVGDKTYALGSKGLMFYLPLSKDIALIFYDSLVYKMGDKKKSYVEVNQLSDIENLNKLSACYANEMLYCLDGSISTYKLGELADLHDKFRPTEKVDTIEGIKHNGGEIVGTMMNSILCKLLLSFVKELPKSKAITPNNYNPLQDRLRPIAYIRDKLIAKPKTK